MYFDEKEFGKRVAALRNAKKLLQDELSENLNISRVHLAKIESGKRTASLDLMIEIAEYFGVSLDYLILGRIVGPDREKCKESLHQVIDILNDMELLYESAM